jgi:hypothetical protein
LDNDGWERKASPEETSSTAATPANNPVAVQQSQKQDLPVLPYEDRNCKDKPQWNIEASQEPGQTHSQQKAVG